MRLRRLCTLFALTAVLLSSGCCWHRHCCRRPLFPRMRGCCYSAAPCCEATHCGYSPGVYEGPPPPLAGPVAGPMGGPLRPLPMPTRQVP